MVKVVPVETFDCVVFGATGDLTLRKLLPALYYRFRDGQIPPDSHIVGVARGDIPHGDYHAKAMESLEQHVAPDDLDRGAVEKFLAIISYVPLDVLDPASDWSALAARLTEGRVRMFYLATSPDLYGPICRALGAAGLNTPQSRVVLEKPIGRSLESALAIIHDVAEVFTEAQTFRIDHFLGKETVQNLMALRFANTIFERLWTTDVIDHVQITVAETVGLEGRAGYYDRAGALRDMVQNHLLQLLCMIAMEPPVSLDADRVRDEKLKVLRALKPLAPHEVATQTVRGQYAAGAIDGQSVPGYATELGSTSGTETFVALKAEIMTWRWAHVPFYLRTGKRLPRKVSEIIIQFRAQPFSIFPAAAAADWQPNRLVIRLQPEEGMRLDMMTKDPSPGGGLHLSPTGLDIRFDTTFGMRFPDAYERLLMDAVRGDATLFMRRDEVEAAWRWIEPILDAWEARPEPPRAYPAGSWGPTSSIALIERDGRSWYEDGV